jgi:transcription initiation factor TFIIIB Brf1 subunit/transcription initiation factor TFIIB
MRKFDSLNICLVVYFRMCDLWPGLRAKSRDNTIVKEYFDEAPVAVAPVAAEQEEEPSYCCPTCEDSDAIETQDDEVVCLRCGTVIDIPLDWSAEYRWYSADNGGPGSGGDPSRCGFPINPLMPESSLGTLILHGGGNSATMRRIKRYHMWNQMPYREHTLWKILETLQIRASNAGIGGAIVEEAKELFAQLTASQICRGTAQRDAVLAACLWVALKRHDAQRLPKDIAEIFLIPLKNVTKGIKQFQHVLAMRTNDRRTDTYTKPAAPVLAPVPASATSPDTTGGVTKGDGAGASEKEAIQRAMQRKAQQQATVKRATSYADFIGPFLSHLSIPRRIAATMEEMVFRICSLTEELNIVPENTPPSLTASVIAFVAAELHVTLDHAEIARVCGISAVTIQKCLKRMAPWKEKLLKK